MRIREMQHWLREQVPAEAVLPSEKLVFGHKGTEVKRRMASRGILFRAVSIPHSDISLSFAHEWQFEGYTAANTLSVDGFLYEEDDVRAPTRALAPLLTLTLTLTLTLMLSDRASGGRILGPAASERAQG